VFEEKNVKLQKGDVLVLYTDGITEAQNESGELFGSERLCKIISETYQEQPDNIIDLILKEVYDFCKTRSLEDDISLVIMKVI